MSWTTKEQPSSLDNSQIPGLYFLVGDLLARPLNAPFLKGQKLPLIEFPSGLDREVWESSVVDNAIVHLFGEMDLLYRQTRDIAYDHAIDIAEQVGYAVYKREENVLEVWGDEGHYLITYDNVAGHMVDVRPVRSSERPPRQPLLDKETWEKLPPLRGQEALGLEALAFLKLFTPDSNWTWYASEASAIVPRDDDPEREKAVPLSEIAPDDPRIITIMFFGLVSGFEIELGSFSLEEVEGIRGSLGLPVERDRYFEPQTLRELQEKHLREQRGE